MLKWLPYTLLGCVTALDHVEMATLTLLGCVTASDHVEMATLHVNGIVATAGLQGV
jgi:hypothetical protein